MKIMLTKCVSLMHSIQKALLQCRIMSADPSGVIFAEFFREKYPPTMDKYIMVVHVGHIVCSKAPDDKLKMNELEPNQR